MSRQSFNMDYNMAEYNQTNNNQYCWNHFEFTNFSTLFKYVEKIKPLLIGKSIDKILVNPNYYETDGDKLVSVDNYILSENNQLVSLDSGTPAILEIENHKLVLNMYYGSWLEISLDKDFVVKDTETMPYFDVSTLYSKNIIGRRIKDIKINKISRYDAESNITLYPNEVLGDDMFQSLSIKLANGYSLVNQCICDNSAISEVCEQEN